MKKQTFFTYLVQFLIVLVSFFAIALYVYSEKTIYFWDHGLYWYRYIESSRLLSSNAVEFVHNVWTSIRNDSYNNIPIIALIPFSYFLGVSRYAYISSVFIVYVLGSYFAYVLLLHKVLKGEKHIHILITIVVVSFIFFFGSDVIGPVVRGYLDVGALGIQFLVIYVYLQLTDTWFKRLTRRTLVLTAILSFLIAFLPLFRRYMMNVSIAFIFGMSITQLYNIIDSPEGRITKLKNFIAHITILCIGTVFSFIVLSNEYWKTMLTTDYRGLYSAWRVNFTYGNALSKLINGFGFFTSVGILATLISIIKEKKFRNLGIFLTSSIAISLFLFWRVQYLDNHHYYMILGFILVSLGISISLISRSILGRILIIFAVIIVIVQSFNAFVSIGNFINIQANGVSLFSNKEFRPYRRSDIGMINTILGDLRRRWIDGETIYIAASSITINDDIIRNQCFLHYSFNDNFCHAILGSAHVDSRDGYPLKMLGANYVITTQPVQYHLLPSEQKTILFVTHYLQNNSNKYLLFQTYVIEKGIRVYTYQRLTNNNKKTINDWNDYYE